MKLETFVYYLVGYFWGKYEEKVFSFIKRKVFKK